MDHRQNSKFSAWLLPGVIVAIAAILAFGGDWARECLRYDREAIAAGELWRLLSGHFVHLGWSHFLLNGAGLLLIYYLVGSRLSGSQWLLVILFSTLGIDLGFWFWQPQLYWYVGLSGILHGILAAGAVDGLRTRQIDYWLIMAFLLFKLSYEQLQGPLPGSEGTTGGTVVVAAHLYGAISGALIGAAVSFRNARSAAI